MAESVAGTAGAEAGGGGDAGNAGTAEAGSPSGGASGTAGSGGSGEAGGVSGGTSGSPGGAGAGGSGAGGSTGGTGGAGGAGGSSPISACGSPTLAALNTGSAWPAGTTQLVDFGLVTPTDSAPAFYSGNRAVATDEASGGWLLWDVPNGVQLARGRGYLLGLGGSNFLVGTDPPDPSSAPTKFEIRAASDGRVLGTIANTSHTFFRLADDGSYLWSIDASSSVLNTWSPTGALLHSFSIANLSTLGFQAAPGKITMGGADSKLHFLNTTDGTQTTSTATYSGSFVTMFADASHFITQSSGAFGPIVRVYAPDLSLVATVSLSSSGGALGGQGDYFWSGNAAYPVSDATFPTPAFTWTAPIYTWRYARPPAALAFNAKLAALGLPGATGDYCWATSDNVLRYVSYGDPSASGSLGCGRPTAIAGSQSGTIAAATASGQVLIFDVATNKLTGTVLAGPVSHLTLSADGQTLLALVNDGSFEKVPTSADVYALPSATLTKSWTSKPQFVRLSRNGSKLTSGCAVSSPSGANSTALLLPGSIRCEMAPISPGGSVASNTQDPHFDNAMSASVPFSYFFSGTTAVAQGPGYAVGWVDDSRLLVEAYSFGSIHNYPLWTYVSTNLYDNQGNLLGSVPGLSAMTDFYTVSPTQILSNDDGNIYDLGTGAVVWASRGAPAAAVGSQVTWVNGHGVFIATP